MQNKIQAIELLYEQIMDIIGIPEDENSKKTPNRISRMLLEVFENINKDPMEELLPQISLFPTKTREQVFIDEIPFTSFCSHHHMPFIGKARIFYVPNDKLIGLSKIPRIIQWFSKKPQLQEHLTNEIGTFILNVLKPVALRVELYDVVHTCMLCRGVRSDGNTTTSFTHSYYADRFASGIMSVEDFKREYQCHWMVEKHD